MFRICGDRGFQITYENGCTISVQFGSGNYCSNYMKDFGRPTSECADAEIAFWHGDDDFLFWPGTDKHTLNYQTPDQVLLAMAYVRAYNPLQLG